MRGNMAATLHLVPDEQLHHRQQSLYMVTSVQHRERLVDQVIQGRNLEYKRIVDSFLKLKSVPLSPSLITVRSVSSELAVLGITGASEYDECTVSITVSH